eukprot:scaffold1875_cov253-Pinguiococcus_pyrenoidosus.AAC.7
MEGPRTTPMPQAVGSVARPCEALVSSQNSAIQTFRRREDLLRLAPRGGFAAMGGTLRTPTLPLRTPPKKRPNAA